MTTPATPQPERPWDTYGRALQYSIKLLHIDTPVIHGEGIKSTLDWSSRDPHMLHLKYLRAGDRIWVKHDDGTETPFFVEWVRLDRGDPPCNDGQLVHSIKHWVDTVLLTSDSPPHWREPGPKLMPWEGLE